MSKVVTIYMNEDTLELIDKTRKKESRSRSNFICKVLLDYIKDKKEEGKVDS